MTHRNLPPRDWPRTTRKNEEEEKEQKKVVLFVMKIKSTARLKISLKDLNTRLYTSRENKLTCSPVVRGTLAIQTKKTHFPFQCADMDKPLCST